MDGVAVFCVQGGRSFALSYELTQLCLLSFPLRSLLLIQWPSQSPNGVDELNSKDTEKFVFVQMHV